MSIPAQPVWTVQPQPGCQINSTAISADGGRCVLGTSEEYASGDFSVVCYDRYGFELWRDAIGTDIYQGVFWVAISADGGVVAAGGNHGQSNDSQGFLNVYDGASGVRLFAQTTDSRINQVEISDAGDTVVAVNATDLFILRRQAGGFQLAAQEKIDGQYCESCVLSADGNLAVVGSKRDYSSTSGPAGKVTAFQIDDVATVLGSCDTDVGIQRVAISSNGQCWAAARHDGRVMAISRGLPSQAAWVYNPADFDVSVAYAVAIESSADAGAYVAYGANLASGGKGRVFLLHWPSPGNCDSTDLPSPQPTLRWSQALQYDPNPGVNMDRNLRYVTATDGEPESDGKETPGNFYLFDRASGAQLWQYPTSLMNWPMAISANGRAIFGASDNGYAYYWCETSQDDQYA